MQQDTELRIPEWTFGDKLRKARAEVGMDQREFAMALGLTSSTLAAYETGRANPRFKDVGQLATKLESVTRISRSWFLGVNSRTSDYKATITHIGRPGNRRDAGRPVPPSVRTPSSRSDAA